MRKTERKPYVTLGLDSEYNIRRKSLTSNVACGRQSQGSSVEGVKSPRFSQSVR